MALPSNARVGLPIKPFFYTIDQISTLLSIEEASVQRWLFYEGRSVGICPKDRIKATNLAPRGETPVWRVLDKHFIQWLRFKGFKYHERGYIK